jgi:glycosyltransferase involved in cell wall biosynthesis
MDVSIIIPTYNRLWSLPKAISSCFESRLKIEVIVIDDGSTDGTWQWLCEQKNIITIRQENSGKDWAVNKGLCAASGKYIRFLDSDDWLLPGSTDNLYQEAENNDLDITCAGYLLYNENEEYIKEINWTVCDDFIAQQLGECDSSHYSAYIFKRAFITNIPHRQEFGALDDRQFIIEAALKQPRTGYISQPALAHRIHQKEKLQKASGLRESVGNLARLQIYKKCFSILEANNMLTQRRKSAACNTLWHLAHWTSKTHLKDAKEIYNWVYQLNPLFKPTENLVLAMLYKLLGFTFTEKLLKLKRVFS